MNLLQGCQSNDEIKQGFPKWKSLVESDLARPKITSDQTDDRHRNARFLHPCTLERLPCRSPCNAHILYGTCIPLEDWQEKEYHLEARHGSYDSRDQEQEQLRARPVC